MNLITNLVVAVQIFAALAMIGLVLVQHGKGADMGAAFGSGASGSLFGATGSANFLSRSTGIAAGVFFVATLALSFIGSRPHAGGAGVMDQAPASIPAPAKTDAAPAAAPAQAPAKAAGQAADIPK